MEPEQPCREEEDLRSRLRKAAEVGKYVLVCPEQGQHSAMLSEGFPGLLHLKLQLSFSARMATSLEKC